MLLITGYGVRSDGVERLHYLAVRSLPALLKGITSNHHGDFYCLNYFHSHSTNNKLKKHERVCNNHDYCNVDMPKELEKIKYSPGDKPLKAPFIIYADLECLLKKVRSRQNNPENSYTEKKVKHKPSGYAWCSIYSFDETKNRRYFHRGKDCIEKFCKNLKQLVTEITDFEEKEMIPLTNKEIKSYEKQKVCYICKKKLCHDKNKKADIPFIIRSEILSLHWKI